MSAQSANPDRERASGDVRPPPVPDVVGLEREEALHRLSRSRVPVWELRSTSPPNPWRLLERWRVVQQRSVREGVILVLAREMAPEAHESSAGGEPAEP